MHRHARPAHAHSPSNPYTSLTARPIRHSEVDDYIKFDYCPIMSHQIRVEPLTPLEGSILRIYICLKAPWQRRRTASLLGFGESERASRIIANSVNPIICRLHFYVASDKQRLISDAPGLQGNKGSLGLIPVGGFVQMTFFFHDEASGSLRKMHGWVVNKLPIFFLQTC